MLVYLLIFTIGRTTPARYVPFFLEHGKQKKLDNLKGYKEKTKRTITNWGMGLSIVRGRGLKTLCKFY